MNRNFLLKNFYEISYDRDKILGIRSMIVVLGSAVMCFYLLKDCAVKPQTKLQLNLNCWPGDLQ